MCALFYGQDGAQNLPVVHKYQNFFYHSAEMLSLVNPSACGMNKNIEASVGSNTVRGYSSNFFTSFFVMNMRLTKYYRELYPYNAIGVYLYNDSEGKYINRGRLYFQYAWHARLGNKSYFSGGLKLGGVNYYVKLPDYVGGNASDYGFDGGASISFYASKYYVGISIDQVFSAQLQPLEEITELSPFLSINANRQFNVNEFLKIKPLFYTRFTFENKENIYLVHVKAELQDILFGSVGFRNTYGMIYALGIQHVESKIGNFSLALYYIVPNDYTDLKINTFEFGLHYFFKKAK